jgi:hypothetical protein
MPKVLSLNAAQVSHAGHAYCTLSTSSKSFKDCMSTNYLSPLKETYMVITITTDVMRVDIGENYDSITL